MPVLHWNQLRVGGEVIAVLEYLFLHSNLCFHLASHLRVRCKSLASQQKVRQAWDGDRNSSFCWQVSNRVCEAFGNHLSRATPTLFMLGRLLGCVCLETIPTKCRTSSVESQGRSPSLAAGGRACARPWFQIGGAFPLPGPPAKRSLSNLRLAGGHLGSISATFSPSPLTSSWKSGPQVHLQKIMEFVRIGGPGKGGICWMAQDPWKPMEFIGFPEFQSRP